jgi:hypothetical protein
MIWSQLTIGSGSDDADDVDPAISAALAAKARVWLATGISQLYTRQVPDVPPLSDKGQQRSARLAAVCSAPMSGYGQKFLRQSRNASGTKAARVTYGEALSFEGAGSRRTGAEELLSGALHLAELAFGVDTAAGEGAGLGKGER